MITIIKPSNLEEFRSLKSKRVAIYKFRWTLGVKEKIFKSILILSGVTLIVFSIILTWKVDIWGETISDSMSTIIILAVLFIGIFAVAFGLFWMDNEFFLQKKDFDYMRKNFPSDLYEAVTKDLTINQKPLTDTYLYNLMIRIDNILDDSKDYEDLARSDKVNAEFFEKQKHYIDAQKDL